MSVSLWRLIALKIRKGVCVYVCDAKFYDYVYLFAWKTNKNRSE